MTRIFEALMMSGDSVVGRTFELRLVLYGIDTASTAAFSL